MSLVASWSFFVGTFVFGLFFSRETCVSVDSFYRALLPYCSADGTGERGLTSAQQRNRSCEHCRVLRPLFAP